MLSIVVLLLDRQRTALLHKAMSVRLPSTRTAKMGDSSISNVTGNVNGNLINVMRGIKPYGGEKPEDFSDWRKKTGFILSIYNARTRLP